MTKFSPADGIRDILTGETSLVGFTIIVGHGRDDVNKLITLVDSGGQPSNPKWLLDFPNVQAIIRTSANEHRAGWLAAKAVKDICLGRDSGAVLGDRYVAINLLSDISFIGRDENNRPMHTVNFTLIIEPQTNTDTNRDPL